MRGRRGAASMCDSWAFLSDPQAHPRQNTTEIYWEAMSYGELGRSAIGQELKVYINRWRRRSIYAGVAFLASAGIVVPFLYGNFLHAYWNDVGVYLVMLSMVLITVFLFCFGTMCSFWIQLRETRKSDNR
jgi:hypothetical protein